MEKKLEDLRQDESSVINEIKELESKHQEQVAFLYKIQGAIEAVVQLIEEGKEEDETNSDERGEG